MLLATSCSEQLKQEASRLNSEAKVEVTSTCILSTGQQEATPLQKQVWLYGRLWENDPQWTLS